MTFTVFAAYPNDAAKTFLHFYLSSIVLDTHAQKISHLKTLYHLACADGVYSEVEAIYIKNVAIKLGIDPQVLHDFDHEEPDLVLPDTQYKIYSLFHRLVLIVMIDSVAHENEKHYCFNLGIKMGLHPNAIDEIIDHAALHGSFKTNPADVIQIFKKYMSWNIWGEQSSGEWNTSFEASCPFL